MQTRFYLVRHGENTHVKDSELTELGMKQSAWIGSKLPKHVPIFSSTIRRAKQTAQIISGITGSDVVFDDRLRERLDLIDSENLGFTKYRELIIKSNQDPNFELPTGQSSAKKGNEVYSLFNELMFCKQAIFVSHSGAILDFMKLIYPERNMQDWQRFRTPYASINIISFTKQFELTNQILCPYANSYS